MQHAADYAFLLRHTEFPLKLFCYFNPDRNAKEAPAIRNIIR
jgi:hypothetical protein